MVEKFKMLLVRNHDIMRNQRNRTTPSPSLLARAYGTRCHALYEVGYMVQNKINWLQPQMLNLCSVCYGLIQTIIPP